MSEAAYDLDDDGAVEVVGNRPRRRALTPPDPTAIAQAPAGQPLQLVGKGVARESVLIREPGRDPIHLPMAHLRVYELLRTRHNAILADATGDLGVTIAEIQEAAGLSGSSARSALESLVRNKLATVTTSGVGFGRKNFYFPTHEGDEVLGLLKRYSSGVMIRIGGTANAYTARNQSEPHNLFEIAALLGARPAKVMEAEG